MYVPEELKINRFKEVRIPKKSEYFNTGRYIADNGVYGGESELVNMNGTTKQEDAMALMAEYDKLRENEEK